MASLCREFGISRKTGYKIFERYEQCGLEGLSDRVRRPFRYANQLPAQVEAAIVSAKREKPHWGARKIRCPTPSGFYRGIPEPHYPFHDRTVVVTSCGRLCLYNKKINLSLSLAGQAVAVKEVDHGIWLVSFMEYDLGYIDLEEKTLQPLENPFGPKV